jgi:hypothetical protein
MADSHRSGPGATDPKPLVRMMMSFFVSIRTFRSAGWRSGADSRGRLIEIKPSKSPLR